jgi:transposase-like protein
MTSTKTKHTMNDKMNSDKTANQKTLKTKTSRANALNLSASDKAQAVLAVWTERLRPVEVCRQLQIPYVTLHQWQSRAMEGMLQALESRLNLSKGEALSPRLQALLQNRQRSFSAQKLSTRLEQIQNKIACPSSPMQKTD